MVLLPIQIESPPVLQACQLSRPSKKVMKDEKQQKSRKQPLSENRRRPTSASTK